MRETRTIDDYLSKVPEEMRSALSELRRTIAAAAPEATEAISYRMPAFRYRGRILVYFAAFKNHCSFLPGSGTILDAYEAELARFRTSKGTLRFTPDGPIPRRLVQKIVRARLREIESAKR